MADTRHHLSLLHANRPSVFEVVAQSALVPAPEWLNAAMLAFAGERDLMSRLMVAAGPPPSRLGQTSVQETVSATRTALLTLAGSDRLGCAIGAAAALLQIGRASCRERVCQYVSITVFAGSFK